MTVPSLARFKRCAKCGCTKPADETHFALIKQRNGGRGWYSYCRLCARLDSRQSNKRRYARHRQEIQQYMAAWRKENHALVRSYYRRWLDANVDKERIRKRLAESKRRAQKAVSAGSVSISDIDQMYDDQSGMCAYCEVPLFGTYHLDHMRPVSRGGRHDWSNLAVVCPACNLSKSTKTVEEFFVIRHI